MRKPEFDIKALPINLRPVGEKLMKLGYGFFKMPKLGSDVYGLSHPLLASSRGTQDITIVPRSAMKLLLTEAVRGQLMLKMADPGWGNKIYGRGANFSTMSWAGCGPTSFAIIMNYLLRTSPGGSKIGPASRKLPTSTDDFDIEKFIKGEGSAINHYPDSKALMLDIIKWAGASPSIRPGPNAATGKLSGTSGKALARNVKHKFQGFAAELVKDSGKAVKLLKKGELLMAGGPQQGWKTREALLRNPNSPDANKYPKAHFIVLWGADQVVYRNNIQIIWVIDSANLKDTKAIRYTTLNHLKNKTFIHVYRNPSKNLIDCLLST